MISIQEFLDITLLLEVWSQDQVMNLQLPQNEIYT